MVQVNALLLGLLLGSPAHSSELGAWLDEAPLVAELLHLAPEDPPLCDDESIVEPTQLPYMPHLYSRWDPERSWGTSYMVDALVAVARQLHTTVPDAAPLFYADLSTREGGWLYGHRTHKNGLDADIGLYSGDRQQRGLADVPPRHLDVETTWVLMDTLLSTERVDYMLLDPSLIARIKTWLTENEVLSPEEIEATFPDPSTPGLWQMVDIVRPAARHRNHLHVHFRCARWTPDT